MPDILDLPAWKALEAKATKGLSTHDHGNCELCDLLDHSRTIAPQAITVIEALCETLEEYANPSYWGWLMSYEGQQSDPSAKARAALAQVRR